MTSTELVPVENTLPPTLFGTNKPAEIITSASELATALRDVIDKNNLFTLISGKKHVRVEGWTLLGTMLGVFPVCVWTKPLENGWEASVEARTLAGQVVGSAEAECTREESLWRNRDDYALRSMAQTRATSKALRIPLGFVVSLAGYAATPAEEMPSGGFKDEPPAQQRPTIPEGEYREIDPRNEAPPSDTVAITCQFCNGPVKDNRQAKTSDKSPDYKCRNTQCDSYAYDTENGLKWYKGKPR